MAERTIIGERDFTPDASSVAGARRYVISALQLDGPVAEAVRLAVSELATNAVLHARSAFVVRVSRDDATARVEVFDRSPAPAARRDYGSDAVTGRGLTIVERVTDVWGVTQDDGGKWVWFEVRLDGEASR